MADAHTKLSAGGSAVDATGNQVDMPRDLAHEVSHELFNVLTLLRSTTHEIDAIGTEDDDDPNGLTCAKSRAASLLAMADDKVRAMVSTIGPYV